MSHTARMDREGFVTEALRAVETALGTEELTAQALRIVAALKCLRSEKPVILAATNPTDYLERVQNAVRAAWSAEHAPTCTGPEFDTIAGIDTPLGRLKAIAFRKQKGERIAWWTEYYLDDQPITLAEIKRAGLAQRPTTRIRPKKI